MKLHITHICTVYKQPNRFENFGEATIGWTVDGRAGWRAQQFADRYYLGDPVAGNFLGRICTSAGQGAKYSILSMQTMKHVTAFLDIVKCVIQYFITFIFVLHVLLCAF